MRRRVMRNLIAWKNSDDRKPLLLFGARQVGKTYLLRQFAKESFSSIAYIDFARDAQAAGVFEGSLNPRQLVPQIEAYLRLDIDPQDTLVVFDEVQLCERALTSMKYFCDEAPEYHVVAAGSLLGVELRRNSSLFPVGKVDMLMLHPLSFEEYLWARGEERLSELIRGCCQANERCGLHERALELIREYQLVGGMPEPVARFVAHFDEGASWAYDSARAKQQEIDQAYVADIAKYAPSSEMPRIMEAWQSIPDQLMKENHKFQYSKVRTGARASQYENALAWLSAAHMVEKCTQVSEGIAPLKAFEERGNFKLYKADTGLLAASFQAIPADLLPNATKAARFRGGLTENYVMQQLVSQNVKPYYWGTASKAEVEFVVRDGEGNIVPVEVKSGANVRSASLDTYRRKYSPAYAVRISAKNFGYENGIRSIPLYAVSYFAEELLSGSPGLWLG